MHIDIEDQLRRQGAVLAVVRASVAVADSSAELRQALEEAQRAAAANGDGAARHERSIAATREAVRAVGWNVNRYRVSSEALSRRVSKGDRVPSVNNVVDINNLLSIESGWPIGSYDLARVEPPLSFRVGRAEESYQAIGGASFKIEALPVFADRAGPFGSVVRDSGRAIVGPTTTSALMVIVGFGERAEVEALGVRAAALLETFAAATAVERAVVGG
jgi:DNA/RNA-binding domain of Phe-tRNA-synthetase-like protein